MMYSPNLPIEEQRRLDQSWSNQAQWGQAAGDQAQPKRTLSTAINPYREGGLTSINPFAKSLFPIPEPLVAAPTTQAAPTKDIYDSWTPEQKSEWDRYGEFGKPRKDGLYEIDQPNISFGEGTEVLPQPGTVMPQVMPQPGTVMPQVMPQPGTVMPQVMPYVEQVMPQPEDPLPGPPNRPPPDFPQPINRPRPPVMLPLPGQENPYPVGPIRPEVMPRPGMPRPEVTPRPGPQPFLGTLLPTGQQQSGLTYSDDEKIRPPSIQVSRKHGGSLTQTVLNVLRNLS